MGDLDLDALLADLGNPSAAFGTVQRAAAPPAARPGFPSPMGGLGGLPPMPGIGGVPTHPTFSPQPGGLPLSSGGLPPLPTATHASPLGGLPPLPTATHASPVGALGGLPPLPTATHASPLGGLPPLPTATQASPIGVGIGGLPGLPTGSPMLGLGGLPQLPAATHASPVAGLGGLPSLPGQAQSFGAAGLGGLPPLPGQATLSPLGGLPPLPAAGLTGLPPLPAAVHAQPIGGGLPPMPAATHAVPMGLAGLPPMPTASHALPLGGLPPVPSAMMAQPIGAPPQATLAQPIGGLPQATMAHPVGAPLTRAPGHYTPPTPPAQAPATHTPDGRALDFGPARTCARCQQNIFGPALEIEGVFMHRECFTCFQCGEQFEGGMYFMQDGLPYCKKDWAELFAPKCHACTGPIDGNAVEVMGRRYHPLHFRCYRCSKDLVGIPYVECQGEPHCENCADEIVAILPPDAPICSKCKLPIYGEFLRIDGQYLHPEHYLCALCGCEFIGKNVQNFQDKLYCHECYLKMLAGVCFACQKPIVGLSKQALGRTYHHTCFVCTHCRVPIGESKFWEHDGNPYCTTHFGQLYCDPCNKCGLPVLNNGATVWGKTWHLECLVCHGCEGPLPGGQFINWEQKPLCLACFKKLNKKTRKLIREKMAKEEKQFKKAAAVAASEHKEKQKELAAERALLAAKRAEVQGTTYGHMQETQKAAASAEKDKQKSKKARSKVRYG